MHNKFNIGDIVYLKTDNEQLARIVTGIMYRKSEILYGVSHITNEAWHYEFEITKEANLLAKFKNN